MSDVEQPVISDQQPQPPAKCYFVSYAILKPQGLFMSDCPIRIIGEHFPIQAVINAIQEQVKSPVSIVNWKDITEGQFNEIVEFRQKPKLATPDKKIITP